MHPGEERGAIRYLCHIGGTVHGNNGKSSAEATVINYSRTGICLQSRAAIHPAEGVRFTWQGKSDHAVTATVRRLLEMDGIHLIGCSLERGMGFLVFRDHYDEGRHPSI